MGREKKGELERERREAEGMEERRDPVIKLFGKTIQLMAVREVLVIAREDSGHEKKAPSNKQNNKEPKYTNEETGYFQEEKAIDEHKISETKEEKTADQQNKNSNNSMDKTLKKPDNILPCPRCNSMDTKFCYFNNYNVNQPRHFCKNCQRYWTEGGSMRNVPVGAGRRKSKSYTTNHQYHHITIPDCVQAEFDESVNHPNPLKLNGTVLSFSANDPLCESMEPNGEDKLSKSYFTTWNSNDGENKALNSNYPAFPQLNGSLCANPWSHTLFYPVTPYLGVPWLCSGLNSTVLGKRSREGNMLNHSNSGKEEIANSKKSLWFPKTIRINDHEKDEKYSVWAKLGFKSDKADRVLKNRSTEASHVLYANPAALSRALSFQERS